jgi:hypothetical protein
MMNKSIVPIVIAALKEIELDGETMERIINEVGMRDQMIKQLTPQDDIVELEQGEDLIVASFTKNALIEYTSLIQERCKQVAIEAIKDYGIEGDEYIELELDYNNTIQTNFDDGAFIKEIESIIEEAFGTDDDSVFDEATNVIQFMKKV